MTKRELLSKFWHKLNEARNKHQNKANEYERDNKIPDRVSRYEQGVSDGLQQAKRMLQQFIYDEGL